MEWLVVAAVALVCLFAGIYWGQKLTLERVAQPLSRLEAGRAEDRASFLHVVMRELGSQLIWRAPGKFVDLYKALLSETTSYKSFRPDELQKAYDAIAKRYPQYSDFDVHGVRTYVLTPGQLSYEELAAHYSDLARFVALLATTDRNWASCKPVSAEEYEHLTEYAQRIADTKFKLRLQRAADDFSLLRSASRDWDWSAGLEDDVRSVRPVYHVAENRLGIRFKDTGEYGLYSFYVGDNDRVYHGYFRSDPSFQSEKWLSADMALFEHFGGVRD